jgi:quinol monooxygenase YgiN
MVFVLIEINVIPGKRKELVQTLLAMMSVIRQEKNCIDCRMYQDLEDKNAFRMFQEWKSRWDLKRHLNSDIFGVLLGTKTLLRDRLNIKTSEFAPQKESILDTN